MKVFQHFYEGYPAQWFDLIDEEAGSEYQNARWLQMKLDKEAHDICKGRGEPIFKNIQELSTMEWTELKEMFETGIAGRLDHCRLNAKRMIARGLDLP